MCKDGWQTKPPCLWPSQFSGYHFAQGYISGYEKNTLIFLPPLERMLSMYPDHKYSWPKVHASSPFMLCREGWHLHTYAQQYVLSAAIKKCPWQSEQGFPGCPCFFLHGKQSLLGLHLLKHPMQILVSFLTNSLLLSGLSILNSCGQYMMLLVGI